MSEIATRARHRCFGGSLSFHTHRSGETGTDMRFGVFTPPQADRGPVPALFYLAGLECNEETFLIKAGAIRLAAELGLMLVAPDTSPRGAAIPGEEDDWDLGTGAGFYVDATAAPWNKAYRMYSYVSRELPALIEANFPALGDRRGIFGHSMGGHGALVVALRQPERWQSVSAFAPISNPVAVPWGLKAFSSYLGPDSSPSLWAAYDASLLMAQRRHPGPILVDQGLADKFLETQLLPETLEAAAKAGGQDLTLRRHEGYDHSYWFIQSFVADHLRWHARALA
ncbi:S-formylglutathione hydrolase [Telmatospirillum siberiense]|uniref:S-formylglutathione hydrolase n=1 Tax=Telmatospirillum siberiense TaxID=382514 RepID=A0A2N3PMD2_9PROT|nr:S-formylglutathione hydrolase [Telmatospirillum siberiense]PKU21555.1 S-formylglutathione hydrolase [Telmatospirillum siberiense]